MGYNHFFLDYINPAVAVNFGCSTVLLSSTTFCATYPKGSLHQQVEEETNEQPHPLIQIQLEYVYYNTCGWQPN